MIWPSVSTVFVQFLSNMYCSLNCISSTKQSSIQFLGKLPYISQLLCSNVVLNSENEEKETHLL